jgi:hypothetical protein
VALAAVALLVLMAKAVTGPHTLVALSQLAEAVAAVMAAVMAVVLLLLVVLLVLERGQAATAALQVHRVTLAGLELLHTAVVVVVALETALELHQAVLVGRMAAAAVVAHLPLSLLGGQALRALL